MSDERGTFERLLLVAGEALQELGGALAPGSVKSIVASFGVHLDDILDQPQVAARLATIEAASARISTVLPPLRNALSGANSIAGTAALISAATDVVNEISAALTALRALPGALVQAANAAVADPAERARVVEFANQFARLLLERMILERLDRQFRATGPMLATLGLGVDYDDWAAADTPRGAAHRVRRLFLNRISKLISQPSEHLRDVFGWGAPDFDGEALFQRIARWAELRRVYATLHDAHSIPPSVPPRLDLAYFALVSDASVSPPGLAVEAINRMDFDFTEEYEIAAKETPSPNDAKWTAYALSKSRFDGGFRVTLTPDGRFIPTLVASPTLNVRAGIKMEAPEGAAVTLLGVAGGTRLEARKLDIAIAAEGLDASPRLEFKQEGLNFALDLGEGDSFLKSLSGGGRGKPDVSVGATWAPDTGLKLTGSTALELAIPAHARIGPATIETVYVVCNMQDGRIPLELSAAVRGELGPFKAVIDRVGVEFDASFPEDGGNLGPIQLDTRFKPPSGVGISIEGGGFTGGGFLRFDKAKGEYSGALELQFQDVIDVKAVGILNTRLPDGSAGYSLIIIITAEFTPIQLGLGFTLMGVGGLLGVNRTVLEDQLRLGVADGTLNSILFPKDVVANAPRIINDLQRVFPPRRGSYLLGPMGKLGWGTPTLISVEMGVIVEVPRVFIVGVLRMAAPADDVPVLQLQVNFGGLIDFEKSQLSFDATLVDSRFLNLTLTGDMAVRAYWGEDENLLLTVGGFHPSFTPPPMALGQIDRLAISLFQGNPNLRAEGYFAVTSNTLQFGAKIEVKAGVRIFNVYGFLQLDALFSTETMRFVADIAGMVAVRSGSSTLFAIRLELTLEGPLPLHARGRGSFEIGFIVTVTISVSFDVTIGVERLVQLPVIVVAPLIEAALREDRNWHSALGALTRAHVSTRDPGAGAPVILSPCGTLAVRQRIAPLNLPLSRIGSQRVEGASTFSIVNVRVGGEDAVPRTVSEKFAAAQYFDMSDAEKLSRRSFEPFDAGVELGGGAAPVADFQRGVDVAYEVVYLRKPRQRLFFRLRDGLIDLLTTLSSAGRSKLSPSKNAPSGLGTPPVAMPSETFVIAGVADLQPQSQQNFASQSAAVIAMRSMVASDASLAGKLQVVSSYELAA